MAAASIIQHKERKTDDWGIVAVSVQQKLVAYHIARLKDKSAAVRLKTIKELAELGDPDALDALQSIYRHDLDPEVRQAAQEAGRQIFLKNRK